MPIKKCLSCGIEFYVKSCSMEKKKFHNKVCMIDYQSKHPMPQEIRNKISKSKTIKKKRFICRKCGKKFCDYPIKKRKYCSRECGCSVIGKLRPKSRSRRTNRSLDHLPEWKQRQAKTLRRRYKRGELVTWNKGLTKETDKRVADYVKKQTKWRNEEGPKKEIWKQAMSKAQVKAHAAGKYPKCFTKPEKITWDHLNSIGFFVKEFKDKSPDDQPNTWYHQFNFMDAFVPDFACPDLKCVIEVNGCYMHGHNPEHCSTMNYIAKFARENIKRDKKKYSMYYRHGWKWALVWECEAKKGDFHRIRRELGI